MLAVADSALAFHPKDTSPGFALRIHRDARRSIRSILALSDFGKGDQISVV